MIELRNITRKFGEFTALDQVNFTVGPGEIVGLLGENGAGKSTLMNIVGGLFPPTAGQMLWQGQTLTLSSPREATALGIGVVHQHFMLVPVFTVAENVALHAPNLSPIYHAQDWRQRIEAWARSLGWRVDASRRVEELSVGERQRVEIIKALFSHADSGADNRARLLLLDEPTANLTPAEVEELSAVLRRLREQGCGIVFVSHKLNEVLSLCDRIVTLRHGRVVGEVQASATHAEELAGMMVGREFKRAARAQRTLPTDSPTQLRLELLNCGKLRDISLVVRRGEIVGIAGVDGNGQAELVEVLSGLRKPDSGGFTVAGQRNDTSSIAVIPPDRQHVGLILDFDLAENMALQPELRRECGGLGFNWPRARERTRTLMGEFDVRTPVTAERSKARQLSGGNQQKLVIARALSFAHQVVVAADPTRGLDVGAAQFVHEQLRAAADRTGVLLISTDLDEVLQLSDRIGVLYEGRLLPGPELLPADTSREAIGALMGGRSL